jgi:hypothetical protein
MRPSVYLLAVLYLETHAQSGNFNPQNTFRKSQKERPYKLLPKAASDMFILADFNCINEGGWKLDQW